jgi:hypothetical protein
MAAIEMAMNDVEVAALKEISRSRSEPAIRVQRARIQLAYRESLSFFCGGACRGGAPSDGPALRGASQQSKARWQRSLTGRRPVRHRRSPLKPRRGLKTWLAIDTQNLSHLLLELRVTAFKVIIHFVVAGRR